MQRAFAILHGSDFENARAHGAFGQLTDLRTKLTAIAIEQDDWMAAFEAQHAYKMLAGLCGKQDFRADLKRLLEKMQTLLAIRSPR